MVERGVVVDRTTLNRWIIRYTSPIAGQAQKRKRPTLDSRRVDKTYIKGQSQMDLSLSGR